MSYADVAKTLIERRDQFDQELINERAKQIAEDYLEKLRNPCERLRGQLLPDGKSYSCIDYCAGMSVNEKRAVAALLTEAPYGFKVDADFDYNNGDRIVISP